METIIHVCLYVWNMFIVNCITWFPSLALHRKEMWSSRSTSGVTTICRVQLPLHIWVFKVLSVHSEPTEQLAPLFNILINCVSTPIEIPANLPLCCHSFLKDYLKILRPVLPNKLWWYIYIYRVYRVSQEEWTKLRESVPYVKVQV